MTEEQKRVITKMRLDGHSFAEIEGVLGISRNTIRKHCQRHPVDSNTFHCLYCKVAIPTVHGRKQPKFCSARCRKAWWKEHPDAGNRKAYYTIVCAGCGREFQSYGKADRKYCSHECYIRDHFKGGASDE